jgi:group II intron reverse transcriptase/maturase
MGVEPALEGSMERGGTANPVERPERSRGDGDGIAGDPEAVCQAVPAPDSQAGDEAPTLLEKALRRENLWRAYQRVRSNAGAPGVDGMTVRELPAYLRQEWPRIREALLSGTYQPQPVRKVAIPKPTGGTRTLGIPTVLDRLIQQAILQVLQSRFDPDFSEASFGFRPGRSAHGAVSMAREHIASGHRWTVDLDLEKFFDRVNHDVLMHRLGCRVEDKRLLTLIGRYLRAGLLDGGIVSPRTAGTPQGGPLSPLLSNILLDDLDRELERRGHRFVRYADDCNVYVQSRAAGERVLASLERFLSRRLRLTINRSKSAVDRPWKRSFLGYTVTGNRSPKLKPAPDSVRRLKGNIRDRMRRARGRRVSTVLVDLQPLIRGWTAYFRLSEVKRVFEDLDGWLRRRLRALLWRQWKKPRTRMRRLIRLGLDEQRAWRSANNGRGPWWNAGARHMNQAVPTRRLRRLGLLSFIEEQRRLAHSP